MKTSSLLLLCCPVCHNTFEPFDRKVDTITHGKLTCTGCGQIFPVLDGIPQFVQTQSLNGLNRRFTTLYNRFAWAYPAFMKVAYSFIGIREDHARREITDRISPGGGNVLEVSIGPGNNLPYLMNRGDIQEVFGLDISSGQLRGCSKLIKQKGWKVELVLGNAECLPFRDNMFTAVLHVGGINFFNDKQAAINEMIRVARPGAKIVIADETERGAKSYEKTIPGFSSSFKEKRGEIKSLSELIPNEMRDVEESLVWKGWMYCLEFRKP